MKKYIIGTGILIGGILLFVLFHWVYLQDKQQEQLVYKVCLEQGCSESDCKLLSTYQGSIDITCPNGEKISREWGWR